MVRRVPLPSSSFRRAVQTSTRRLPVKEPEEYRRLARQACSVRKRVALGSAKRGVEWCHSAGTESEPGLGRPLPPAGGSGSVLTSQIWACPRGRTRAHGMLGRRPRGGHFVLSAPLWRRLFGLRAGRRGWRLCSRRFLWRVPGLVGAAAREKHHDFGRAIVG